METQSLDEQLETALKLHTAGRLGEAEGLYRQILRQAPDDADALHLLGALTAQQGNAIAAIDLIDRAIAIDPTCAEFQNNKGLILANLGRYDEAIAAHRQAIALNPQFTEAHNNLGSALVKSNRLDEAATAFYAAIALKPDLANAYTNLGVVHQRQNKFDEAIACYRQCLKYQPNHAEAHNNLGVALRETGRMDEAIRAYRAAIAIDPNSVDAHANLGAALHDIGKPEEATVSLNRAIELNPGSASARYNLALTLLQSGDYRRGFAEYESRAYALWSRDRFSVPRWDGQNLAGCSILLHAEGGFGDAIQFARFVPLVKARGGKAIVQAHPELVCLFATLAGADTVISKLTSPPPFESHCPLLSLPSIFSTTLDTIPTQPYLSADRQIAQSWAAKFGDDKRLRVGLAWAGSPKHHNDKNRSIPLELFAPLGKIPGIRFISVQQDRPGTPPPAGLQLDDWTTELQDFADLAGLIENLDLVISVDTAVAHLSGAMGKKVNLLLPYVADWRWLRDRTDSPWYPTITIFPQQTPGDWTAAIATLSESLRRGAV